jgi:hypothetical protein
MISPDAERIIRDAAVAQRAFTQLIAAAAENPRFRLELIDQRVMIDQELRGESRQAPPAPNIMEPIGTAVDRELERMRPEAITRVIAWRASRRLGGCGYVQLSLSYAAEMRRRLRRFIKDSSLTIAEFAEISGQDETTVHDHLGAGKIPRTRAAWYRAILSIAVNNKTVVITLRRKPRGERSRRV